jgi:hypothetical protein
MNKLIKVRILAIIIAGINVGTSLFALISSCFRLYYFSDLSKLQQFWTILLLLVTPPLLFWNLRTFKRSKGWFQQKLTELRKKNTETRNEIEFYKKKLIAMSFKSLASFAEDKKWAEKELADWRDIIATERFKLMHDNYKKEVFQNMIKLNVFIEKLQKYSDKQKQILKEALYDRQK